MKQALLIAFAGAAGSLARYGAGSFAMRLAARAGLSWPLGTFAVNVLGSFLIGLVTTLFALRGQLDAPLRLALTVGFLGGFTTYSSFAFETVGLLESRRWLAAGCYVLLTLLTAGLACAAGMLLARWLR
ncbi:fluoride efflux transporter CrcB [Haliangium ochraceum]|uniref:Fluoride-specific ion channel FluC n=1 Tax=Haliangium ochraceum (strain DSM 14365 / JCM 11303 / SMP-2) TaxID=502025 RepID=D0LRD6_HALO1|nr:fluoride efflux transporter CrcB [Haliangium ochraceum]ACY17164.1 CrcB protein [Haliangium ochraceum DSM 14365]